MDIIRLFRNPMKNLCGPSLFYLVVSALAIITIMVQNMTHDSHKHMIIANSAIRTPSNILILTVHIIGIMLWCWILNLMCKANHSDIAWLFVLFPYIIIFLCFFLILMNK